MSIECGEGVLVPDAAHVMISGNQERVYFAVHERAEETGEYRTDVGLSAEHIGLVEYIASLDD